MGQEQGPPQGPRVTAGRSHIPHMVASAASPHPAHCSSHSACWRPHPESAFPNPSKTKGKQDARGVLGKGALCKIFLLHLLSMCARVEVRRQRAESALSLHHVGSRNRTRVLPARPPALSLAEPSRHSLEILSVGCGRNLGARMRSGARTEPSGLQKRQALPPRPKMG